MSNASTLPTRKDAARNRARLLKAALELFGTQTDVTLKDVARQAGVGVGTVYRHFPTKEDLLDALTSDQVTLAVDIAREAAAESDGWQGLTRFLEESMRLQVENGCLRCVVDTGEPFSPVIAEARETIASLVQQIVAKAQQQGTLNADLDATDINLMLLALVAVLDATRATSPDRYRHQLALLLDGMRAENRQAASIA
ncbi:TetR/AcrR family transcriptional regulator [Paractinoplanes atraurantiacus]|uniref:DNA-binding transcriptional regulator, AcrR family n=1 Tax=Paractinoplanes atraurantiacus TaxID=1036182 RepID=A0A285HSA3_9ACTN|nr:TetR/AcrR family transcriptional regulator [Actinoplanes atraurantiacus]SNY38483.1 DNA-binding transcriptional regulator, AcrR family [Actinoplanes atraurantiacus]